MVETQEQPKKKHAGGRPKGRRNRKTIGAILSFGELFSDEIEAAGWNRMLNSPDDRVFAVGFKLAVQYKRGLPPQAVKIIQEIQHTMSAEEREASRKVIQRLLPPPQQSSAERAVEELSKHG